MYRSVVAVPCVRSLRQRVSLLSSIVPHGMRICPSSAALRISGASMSIVRHVMPCIAFMFRASMRGMFFVNYAGYYPAVRFFVLCRLPIGFSFFFSPTSDVGFAPSSAALCASIASMSIVRHSMPVVFLSRPISTYSCLFRPNSAYSCLFLQINLHISQKSSTFVPVLYVSLQHRINTALTQD